MDTDKLQATCKAMVAHGKGLLAADTSVASTQKRFDSVGVENTKETRREYRELLLTTPGAEQFLSGVILHDETFWQSTDDGQVFREYLKSHDILPGIKVDKGLVDLPGFAGEKVTQGLDGLPEAMATYAGAGARFAKWRAVVTIGQGLPTNECLGANAYILARYARICQDADIVPIVEPEVLFDGHHAIERCQEVMQQTLATLFKTMQAFRVYLPGVVLKTSMVLPGKEDNLTDHHDDIAARTVRVLHEFVPHELGGVVFMSGGQTPDDAFINLNRMVKRGPHPWGLTFSYDRALQDPVLKAWAKNRAARTEIQQIFHHQLQVASAASKGELDESSLLDDAFVSHAQD